MPTHSYLVPGPSSDAPEVIVRRSTRRSRTVSAFREDGAIVVAIPGAMSVADEHTWVKTMVGRVLAAERKSRLSDEELVERARELSSRYVPGAPLPASITWSSRQGKRWGSCTVQHRTIRISQRVRPMPRYVLDYVIVHELTHLLHRGHGPQFRAVLARYPHTERAEAFLAGVAFADHQGASGADAAEQGSEDGAGSDGAAWDE